MNKYYGLRLIRSFFVAASVIISISTIATIGGLSGLSLLRGEGFDGLGALFALVIGGLIALLCYAFGQLIDLQLNNYEVSWKLMEQIEEANKLNHRTVQLLNKQLRIMYTQYNVDGDIEVDVKKIEQQIAERRSKLSG